jgi:hypothetical protein
VPGEGATFLGEDQMTVAAADDLPALRLLYHLPGKVVGPM